MTRQIALSIRTTIAGSTNKRPHILEIGCVEMHQREFTGRSLHYYLSPPEHVTLVAVQSGRDEKTTKSEKQFSDIEHILLELIMDSDLITDESFSTAYILENEFIQNNTQGHLCELCTLVDADSLARTLYKNSYSDLNSLYKRLGLQYSVRTPKPALKEAYLMAHAYLLMTDTFDQNDAAVNR